jgi:hypothetical protein
MTSETVFQRTQNIDFSRLDDVYLAIDAQKGYCYSLNATAGRIWDMAAEPLSVAKICKQLQIEYTIEEETCRRDVTTLLRELQSAGLLQIVNHI